MSDGPPTGERVVLGHRESKMVGFKWSGKEPEALNDVEWAEELGVQWEGKELVTHDFPGMVELLQYYSNDEYLADND